MSNNNNWRGGRGGGRGRGRGGGGNRNYNNDQNHDNVPITARLGPNSNNNNNSGGNISSRLGPNNANSFNDNRNHPFENNSNYNNSNNNNNNYNNNYNQRGGRAFNNNRGGRGRGGHGGGRFTRGFADEDISMQTDSPDGVIVKVTGFPKGAEDKVLGFLKRKSKSHWEALSIDYGPNFMDIKVADESAADALCRMNNFNFGNATLQLARAGEGQPQTNRPTHRSRSSEVLIEFVKERWSPQLGMFDMEGLPDTSHHLSTVISRLLEAAYEQFGDAVITISLARNKLRNVTPIQGLIEYFPNLLNLSLQDNLIEDSRQLDKLANKLPNLKEIILSGNPIETKYDRTTLVNEVLQRFPSLQFIDNQPVGGGSNDLPAPVLGNSFDNESSAMACQDLLSKFFPLFDTNRSALLALYDAQSVFSCVFSNSGNFQQQNIWGSPQVPPSQRLVIGNENIIKRLVGLPPSQHDISNANNFMTDAWQTPGNQAYSAFLYLVVHGEFIDMSTGTPLSFDRTFIVAPAVPGSSAHSAGWVYVILSDSLIVRNYSCKPGSLVTA
ncbi:hypothetical protein K501DRAFT_326125, partial [Backusella circina FSU 941]